MKTITLQEAFSLIQEANAVIVDDNALVYPSQYELTGEDDNEWLYLSWEEELVDFALTFIEEEAEIKFDGSSIYMEDSDGDECKLTLLVPMNKLAEISI